MSQRNTVIFIGVIVMVGLLIAGTVMWWRASDKSLEGYYHVSDGFVDSTSGVVASVSFVEVMEYDSLRMLRVAEYLTRKAIESKSMNNERARDFLYHFYMPGDTEALSEGIVDELSYTHPEISEAATKLMSVPGGWVVRATFVATSIQPQTVVAKHSAFYMPRTGVRARDLR